MRQVVYVGLFLLGCLVLGSSSSPVEEVEDASEEEAASKSSCPLGALHVRGNCYEFFINSMPWDSAEAECQQLRRGAHLASFSSLREEKLVSTYIRRFSGTYYAWTGLNAMPTSNQLIWEWSDRSPYVSGAALWDNRSPSTSLSSSECVVLYNIQSPSSSTRWLQRDCGNYYPYVCKYKA